MTEVSLRWVSQSRNLPFGSDVSYTSNIRQLDSRYEEITDAQVKQLCVPPLAHQKRTISAMLDIEQTRAIKIGNHIIQTDAAILSERPGSGKSYEILALIQLSPKVKFLPKLIRAVDPKIDNNFRQDVYSKSDIVLYNPDYYLDLTIIFVAKNVINQWREYIDNYTQGIKYLTIEKFHDVKELHAMMTADVRTLRKYKIILVKHSIVTGSTLPDIYPEGMNSGALIDIIQFMFRKYIVKRVVIDDFDVISTTNTGSLISACFTWLVSATNNSGTRRKKTAGINNYHAAGTNPLLFQYVNISCTEAYINQSTRQSDITHNVYKFKARNLQMRTAIDLLNTDIAELVNGDAIVRAGKALKITKENPNIADVFGKLFNTECARLTRAKKLSGEFQKLMEYYNNLPEYEPGSKIKYRLSNISDILRQNDFAKLTICFTTKHPDIDTMLALHAGNLDGDLSELQNKLDRVIEGFKEGECPVTAEPLANNVVAIMRCCAMVFSSEALKIIDMEKGCPNCMANPNNLDYMLLDSARIDLNASDLSVENIEAEEDEEQPEKQSNAISEYDIDDLLSIADGSLLGDTIYNDPQIDNAPLSKEHSVLRLILMDQHRAEGITFKRESFTNLGHPALQNRKWLIFCSDASVVRMVISTGFSKFNVKYGVVSGRSNLITEYIARYKLPSSDARSINVLLITTKNGNSAFAGLDLQITTDIIFMNKYVNQHLQKQMIGRANRIGRNYNLLIHYFCYENELQYIDLPEDMQPDLQEELEDE